MPSTKYDAAFLAPIVASSYSLADVLRKLGLPTTGGNHRQISARIRHANLDTSHFGLQTLRARIEAIAIDELQRLVRRSTSHAQVLTAVALPPDGRASHELKRRIRELQIDVSHFRGHGWARGETKFSHASLARISKKNSRPDEEVFVENSPHVRSTSLRRRLIDMGVPYRCAECGIAEWRGKPLVLELDHINGINNDNRLVNLRFLCPNCHSQTETYCNRRRGESSRASEPRIPYTCYTFSPPRAWRNWYTRCV